MWALIESNTIKEILKRSKSLTVGGVKYPQNIFNIWSESELAEIGIVPVTIDNSNFKNQEYYINTDITYAYDTDTKTVTGTYGTATAKALADSLYTAQDETDGLGTEGDIKSKGLKSMHKEDINSQARNILQDTDWMVIREADGGTAIPSNIKTHRAAVRTKSNEMCTKIDAVSDVDALAALYEYSGDPLVRPLGEFPVL
tara:strand:- start:885 stop:1484 length:600 start_codon:yes stop_codon:yes gene_type:complete